MATVTLLLLCMTVLLTVGVSTAGDCDCDALQISSSASAARITELEEVVAAVCIFPCAIPPPPVRVQLSAAVVFHMAAFLLVTIRC